MSDSTISAAIGRYHAAVAEVDTAHVRLGELQEKAGATNDFSDADRCQDEELIPATARALSEANALLALLGFGGAETAATATAAFARFMTVFEDLAPDLGPHVLCATANRIAAVFADLGDTRAAQTWLNHHYEDCDFEDHPVFDADLEQLPEGYTR